MPGGVKVLSFTHYLQGPSAAQTLADLGTEVVRVESPKGAYKRPWPGYNTYPGGVSMSLLLGNHNQTFIAVDLKSKEGVEIIHKLLWEYDVVIENFRARVMEKLGLGYEDLEKTDPGIIYCSCSGYGSSGPYVKKPGQDLLIQSTSSLVSPTGSNPETPSPVGTPVADQYGAVLATLGVVASIYDRARTEKGHEVEVSPLGSVLSLQQEALGYYLNGGQFTERPTTGLNTRFHQSSYDVYRTGDGCIILPLAPVGKLRELPMSGCLDGCASGDQVERRLEFDAMVYREMKKKTTREREKIPDENGTWHTPANNYQKVLEDRQIRYSDNTLTMHHLVAGDVRVVGRANRYDGENIKIRKLSPKLGESTKVLVGHPGCNEETVRKYREHGIATMGE